MADRMILCAQCDKPFWVSEVEVEQLESKGFSLPRRCPECRRKKWKAANQGSGSRFEEKKKRQRRRSSDVEEWR
jgi:uncharacterized protein with PIN domain